MYAMLESGDTIAWLALHAAIVLADERALSCTYYLSDNYRFSFNVDGKDTFALAPSSGVLMGICDVVRRLFVANEIEVL
jgi:hypothetical protein